MLIPVARANKIFGGDGGLMLTLYPAFPDGFDLATPLFARVDELNVPLYCEQFELRGRSGAFVRFADIDTERRATEFVSKELFVEEEEREADKEDTFYMEDLIGFRAEAEGLSGEVTDYIDSEVNPLFEVTSSEGQPVLIPAIEEMIVHIDFEGRTIRFVLPEGLTELNAK